MIAIKGNKAYTVTEAEAASWAARGYDVYGDEGIVKHGKGSSVSREAHEAALARIAELEAELAAKGGKAKEPTRDDLVARAAELGIEVPSKATKADIEALIEAVEAAG